MVLGAGVAGLFAARVLSERYERVTLIERDPLAAGPGVNPIGDRALAMSSWSPERCVCAEPGSGG